MTLKETGGAMPTHYKPTIQDRFMKFFFCERTGHIPMIEDGYYVCVECWQSLDADTQKGLGWYGYNYFPEGYVSPGTS